MADYGFDALPPAPRAPRDGPLRIGFVGTLTWHKGAHVLLEAVRALPPDAFSLQIAGDLDVFPDYVADLRRRADRLPVVFTGRFDRADAAAMYAGLDVLVVPSLWPENSPLVIHEAFMTGVAVVAARAGGIPGLVVHDVSGLLFDPVNPASLTDALTRLIDDPGLHARLSAAAPPVRSLEQDAAEWEARYRAVAGLRGRRPA